VPTWWFRRRDQEDRTHQPVSSYRNKQAKLEHDGLEEKFKYQGPLIGFNFLL
jgi:hypothetical protein